MGVFGEFKAVVELGQRNSLDSLHRLLMSFCAVVKNEKEHRSREEIALPIAPRGWS